MTRVVIYSWKQVFQANEGVGRTGTQKDSERLPMANGYAVTPLFSAAQQAYGVITHSDSVHLKCHFVGD